MQRRQCGTREIAGTDRVVDYTREDFTPSGETYAVIFDAVGNLSESQGNRALKPNGIYLNVHKASDNRKLGTQRYRATGRLALEKLAR